jgi:signal transduction histidine kinase
MKRKFTLRHRLTYLSLGLYVITLLLLTFIFVKRDESLITIQNEMLRRHLTETLAISITNTLLYQELELIEEGGLIDNYIEEWMNNPELNVRSIRVTNPDGVVVASNDFREYGKEITSLGKIVITEKKQTVVSKIRGLNSEQLLLVSTPLNISTRSWGNLSLTYSLESLHSALKDSRIKYSAVTIAAILLSSILFATYMHYAFKPITELRDFVIKVPDQSWFRARVRKNDEIGDMANAFNEMLDKLEQVRELERETQEKFHQAERVSVIGKLAAGVAHEIRNPLAGIENLVENLEKYKYDSRKFDQYSKAITDGLQRIEKTVDGLVSFAHQSDFLPKPTNLIEIMEETLELTGYNLRKSNIKISWDIPESIPDVHIDGDQFRQVLLNIILNAITAMEETGGELKVGFKNENSKGIELYIEDNGIGIPVEQVDQIFDPFFTTHPVGKGTGLGLAVSDSIIEHHGGQLRVESDEGIGTRFTITLPKSRTVYNGKNNEKTAE